MSAATDLSKEVGVVAACDALCIARSTYYRRQASVCSLNADKKRYSPRALTEDERQAVPDCLNSDRFMDDSPYEVYGSLLDEGAYLRSIRTMRRILEDAGEVKERRNRLRHPNYFKPELLAQRSNEVWSWDITRLKGPQKWTSFYLYVILDIYSRYVTGWMVADRENSELAQLLIEETCLKQDIPPERLTIHADRGTPMKSKATAQLLADLGVTRSHSRPHAGNDNPYSEAQFKTMKYRPEFPKRFGRLEDAKSFRRRFFSWYNTKHRHTGLGLMTPETVRYGLANETIEQRNAVLEAAYMAHPERFVNMIPTAPKLPDAVWINKPKKSEVNCGSIP